MTKIKISFTKIIFLSLALVLSVPSLVLAQSSSNSYKVEESYFGIGGSVDSSSTNYGVRSSAGTLGSGSAASDDYAAEIGFNTPSEPFLEVYVTNATVDLGVLDDSTSSSGAAQADTCNCSFSVRSYLSSEYVVVTASNPPTNESGDSLEAKSVQGAPSVSTNVEEFGINLVDNSSPDIGANPANQPDDTFADGQAATGYQTANQFKYAVGDIVARSPATANRMAIGKTDYTVSYTAKIKSTTPAGSYIMKHDLIVVPTF